MSEKWKEVIDGRKGLERCLKSNIPVEAMYRVSAVGKACEGHCPRCLATGRVEVHGHVQCANCGLYLVPCCEGSGDADFDTDS